MTRPRPLRRSAVTPALLTVGLALAWPVAPPSAQQAGFGSALYRRDPWMVRLDASTDPASTVVETIGTDTRVTTRAGAVSATFETFEVVSGSPPTGRH